MELGGQPVNPLQGCCLALPYPTFVGDFPNLEWHILGQDDVDETRLTNLDFDYYYPGSPYFPPRPGPEGSGSPKGSPEGSGSPKGSPEGSGTGSTASVTTDLLSPFGPA